MTSTNTDDISCDTCGKKFTRYANLAYHKEKKKNPCTSQVKKHVCQRCGVKYKSKGGLEYHNKNGNCNIREIKEDKNDGEKIIEKPNIIANNDSEKIVELQNIIAKNEKVIELLKDEKIIELQNIISKAEKIIELQNIIIKNDKNIELLKK